MTSRQTAVSPYRSAYLFSSRSVSRHCIFHMVRLRWILLKIVMQMWHTIKRQSNVQSNGISIFISLEKKKTHNQKVSFISIKADISLMHICLSGNQNKVTPTLSVCTDCRATTHTNCLLKTLLLKKKFKHTRVTKKLYNLEKFHDKL